MQHENMIPHMGETSGAQRRSNAEPHSGRDSAIEGRQKSLFRDAAGPSPLRHLRVLPLPGAGGKAAYGPWVLHVPSVSC